ncbi:MAG: GntR family transcriptional regulator [Firmicutes bacterium]|nr:GntR family transcriptional regulator [Bacillota bacterium]
MLKVQFDPAKPIYLQIISEVKKALARGELNPGDKLPSQRELAKMIKVNANTVQRAYREMEMKDLARTVRGQGTFITSDEQLLSNIRSKMILELVDSFVLEMVALGCDHETINKLVKERSLKNDEP